MGTYVKKIGLVWTVLALLNLGACSGGSDLLKDVKIKTNDRNGQVWLDMESYFDMGNTQFPNITIPIFKDSKELGAVTMGMPLGTNRGRIALSMNLEEVADISSNPRKLPNGLDLPIYVDPNTHIVGLPFSNSSMAYLGLNNNSAIVGVAAAFSSFDGIGRSVQGAANIFPRFDLGGFEGVAGIFTSNESGKSGLAVFADVSQLWNKGAIGAPVVASSSSSLGLASTSRSVSTAAVLDQPIQFRADRVSRRTMKKVRSGLYKLHKKRSRLRLR